MQTASCDFYLLVIVAWNEEAPTQKKNLLHPSHAFSFVRQDKAVTVDVEVPLRPFKINKHVEMKMEC